MPEQASLSRESGQHPDTDTLDVVTEPSDDQGRGVRWDASLTGLPLPPPAVHILDSLLPIRGRSRRGYNRPPDTLAEAWRPASRASFRDWLGFEPPTLPSLTANHGLSEHFVVHPFEERPPRRAIPPGTNVTLSVLYVPADVEWAAPGSYAAAAERGMVTVSLLTGYGAPWPQAPRPTWQVRTNEGSGDSVVVPLGAPSSGCNAAVPLSPAWPGLRRHRPRGSTWRCGHTCHRSWR